MPAHNNIQENNNKKSVLRVSIVKTITYRFLGSFVSFAVAFGSTGNFKIATTVGAADFILKPLIYFIHEYGWSVFLNRRKTKF